MFCPFLKETDTIRYGENKENIKTAETFAKCYEEECPYFVGAYMCGDFIISKSCRRTTILEAEE